MNYFKSFVGNGAAPADGREIDVVETVEKLLERVETATLLEDRRDAVKALKSLARKYRMEVGGRGMDVMVEVLEKEKGNAEMVRLALETLGAIVGEDDGGGGEEGAEKDELGERFAEMFVKRPGRVSLVLGQLEEWEFGVRRAGLRLLTSLLRHQSEELQNALLQDPAAVPRLLDLLQESREVLRNDAILMMCELTRGNAQIQKLVAFENAFQILLDIITMEGERSIVVEDCLFCILNLLKANPSNQQLFREHSLIQHLGQLLGQLLHPGPDEDGNPPPPPQDEEDAWPQQKVANVLLLFQVIRTLVAPSNSAQIRAAAQKIVLSSGMLGELAGLLLESGVPVEVLTEAIRCVADGIRGNAEAQAYFGAIQAPSQPPKPLALVLLLSMTNDRQPFPLRCSVLYAFQSFLYRNRKGKEEIVGTLLPSSDQASGEVTAGHVLCTGLLSSDPLLVWLSAVALEAALVEEPKLGEELLRVQLATSVGEGPVSLLEQVCSLLVKGGGGGRGRVQLRAGLLQLLAVWLARSSVAVTHFLGRHGDDHLAFLTATASADVAEGPERCLQGLSVFLLGLCVLSNDESQEKFNKAALGQLIERRVGRELAVERLDQVSRSEDYVRAAQKPHPSAKQAQDLVFDHEFTKLFKSLEGDVRKVLVGPSAAGDAPEEQASVVASYKELIVRQDAQIAQLTAQLKRAQEAPQPPPSQPPPPPEAQLSNGHGAAQSEGSAALVGEVARLKAELEASQAQAAQRASEAGYYYQQCEAWRAYQVGQLGPDPAHQALAAQLKEAETQLQWGWKAFEDQALVLAQAQGAAAQATARVQELEAQPPPPAQPAPAQPALTQPSEAQRDLEARLAGLGAELAGQKRETEDLLVLLADQDAKIREYRRRLRGMGQQVSEDEDEEEDVSLR